METSYYQVHLYQQNWSNLPKDILLSILKLLNLKTDLPKLRAVCSSWRSLLPHPTTTLHFPSRIRVPEIPHQFSNTHDSLTLFESRFFLFDGAFSPEKWLAKMVEVESNKWHLLNPLNMQDLFMAVPRVTGSINLCDVRVLELSRAFSLVSESRGKAEVVSEKVVVIETCSKYDFVLALLKGHLFLLRMGENVWHEIEGLKTHKFMDIASHKGRFYAYDSDIRKLVVIDPSTSRLLLYIDGPTILEEHLDIHYVHVYGLYLVPTGDRLYIVIMVSPIDNRFSMLVFLLKEKQGERKVNDSNGDYTYRWEEVKSFGDEILFIGTDASFSLAFATKHLPQWKPSSICLFVKPAPLIFGGCVGANVPKGAKCLDRVSFAEYFRYFEMFDVEEENGCMVPFQELSKEVYTGVFFPPPGWVKWQCPSVGGVEVRLDELQYHCEDDDADYFYEYLDEDVD